MNYRSQTRLTIKNGYPLFGQTNFCTHFLNLVFLKNWSHYGISSVRLDKDPVPKSAFKTKHRSLELTVLLFSLTNARGFFMCTMAEMFSEFLNKFLIFLSYTYIKWDMEWTTIEYSRESWNAFNESYSMEIWIEGNTMYTQNDIDHWEWWLPVWYLLKYVTRYDSLSSKLIDWFSEMIFP